MAFSLEDDLITYVHVDTAGIAIGAGDTLDRFSQVAFILYLLVSDFEAFIGADFKDGGWALR